MRSPSSSQLLVRLCRVVANEPLACLSGEGNWLGNGASRGAASRMVDRSATRCVNLLQTRSAHKQGSHGQQRRTRTLRRRNPRPPRHRRHDDPREPRARRARRRRSRHPGRYRQSPWAATFALVREALAAIAAKSGGAFAGLDRDRREALINDYYAGGGTAAATLGRVILGAYYRDDRVLLALGWRPALPSRRATRWNRATGRCSTPCASARRSGATTAPPTAGER